MIAALLALLFAAAPSSADLLAQLKTDIQKTDRALALTELQIARSRAATYAPELQFRLADLYVEKSRYTYLLQQQELGSAPGSQVAPEVRLLKQKALQIYDRILRDTPDWSGCDRVRFYLAHEYRELGDFDKMLETEEELVKKHPQSPLAGEALLIVGDHWFSAKDLTRAEDAYQRVLAGPLSPARDLAAFKMGWVRFNQSRHADAVKYFETAAASPLLDGASREVLSVKREALFDLVFSFTEARPWKGSVEYFEKLSQSHAVYLGVLEKLANRYFVKQEPEAAVLAYRKLLALSRDSSRDPETAARLHDALKAGGEKTPARAEDVAGMVRTAARVRTDERLDARARKASLEELEVDSRDLATGMLVAARKKPGDQQALSAAADAHASWLSLYRDNPQRPAMQKNLAEALFAAGRWPEAGRAYEVVAADAGKDQASAEDALYNALAAHAHAAHEPAELTAFQHADSLRAMSLLGSAYVSRYPHSARVAQVKFNVARAAYDEADWKRAAELFSAYVAEHPQTPDTAAAANLSLDSLHSSGDYDRLEKIGKQMAANNKLPAALRKEVADTVARARGEQLSVVALESSARSGDAARGLIELYEKQPKSELAERALHAAFTTYREKGDLQKLNEVGARFLASYPTSPLAVDVLSTQARLSLDRADFDSAAAAYEALGDRFPGEATGLDAVQTAAGLRTLLGDSRHAVLDYEKLPPERRTGIFGLRLAEARLQAGDAIGAESAAAQLLHADPANGDAALIQGRALIADKQPAEAVKVLSAALKSGRRARASNDLVAHLWDQLGEAQLQTLRTLPADPLDPQVAVLKSIQEASEAVAQLRAAELAVHGVYRLAQGFEYLAVTLAATPPPLKLSESDQQKFVAAVAGQAAGLRRQAQAAYDGCAKKARELALFAPFVAGCEESRKLSEAPITQSFTPPVATLQIVQARAELDKKPTAAALERLGLTQLAASDVRRARLSFLRALELDEARASAQAALGVALARMGDPLAARDSYRRALELDPTLDRAHAGLAALHCRFGDLPGGREELQRLHGALQAGAADIDPEVSRCAK